MNHSPKRPPPDSAGNIRGRMAELRTIAHSIVMGGIVLVHVDEKGKGPAFKRETPKDYDKRLADALKELAPEFKKLERRLKKCPKVAVVTREEQDAKRSKARATKTPKKPVKKPDTRERAKTKMNGSKNVAASVLDGGETHDPLSRENALTEGVAQDHKPEADILDFMQSTLD